MSGASPWYTSSGSDGEPLVAMSGASGIYDERTEVSVGASYYLSQGTVSGVVGYSEENDYRAKYYAFSASRNFNDELTTLSIGIVIHQTIFFQQMQIYLIVLQVRVKIVNLVLSRLVKLFLKIQLSNYH